MKSKILLMLSIATIFAGCGKNSSSGNGSSDRNVTSQGICSGSTVNLHSRLIRHSENPITNKTDVYQIHQLCVTLASQLGSSSCQLQTSGGRGITFLSYSQVSNYCAEIETYLNQRNPPVNPPPRPVPVPVPPSPRPPRFESILVENLDTRFVLLFEKSYLERNDFDLRAGATRCQISMSEDANVNLRNTRGKIASMSVQLDRSNIATTYNMTWLLSGSNDLVRLSCKSRSERLTLKELNVVLDGVAEIRKK